MNETDSVILNQSESFVVHALHYGKDFFRDEINSLISNVAIEFLVSLKIIYEPFYCF